MGIVQDEHTSSYLECSTQLFHCRIKHVHKTQSKLNITLNVWFVMRLWFLVGMFY
jgi:hypothetical protein